MLLPSALGFSPHPPVSVYGTGAHDTIAAFLATPIQELLYLNFDPHHAFGITRDLLRATYFACSGFLIPGPPYRHVSPHF